MPKNLTPAATARSACPTQPVDGRAPPGGPKGAEGLDESARGQVNLRILLLEVSVVLARKRPLYAVIGAMAAAVYGAIRATTDADALLSVSIAQLGRLEKIFKKAGFATELRPCGDADDPRLPHCSQ